MPAGMLAVLSLWYIIEKRILRRNYEAGVHGQVFHHRLGCYLHAC